MPKEPTKRKNAAISCVNCQKKKRSCRGGTPNEVPCERCVTSNIVCTWVGQLARGPAKRDPYSAPVDHRHRAASAGSCEAEKAGAAAAAGGAAGCSRPATVLPATEEVCSDSLQYTSAQQCAAEMAPALSSLGGAGTALPWNAGLAGVAGGDDAGGGLSDATIDLMREMDFGLLQSMLKPGMCIPGTPCFEKCQNDAELRWLYLESRTKCLAFMVCCNRPDDACEDAELRNHHHDEDHTSVAWFTLDKASDLTLDADVMRLSNCVTHMHGGGVGDADHPDHMSASDIKQLWDKLERRLFLHAQIKCYDFRGVARAAAATTFCEGDAPAAAAAGGGVTSSSQGKAAHGSAAAAAAAAAAPYSLVASPSPGEHGKAVVAAKPAPDALSMMGSFQVSVVAKQPPAPTDCVTCCGSSRSRSSSVAAPSPSTNTASPMPLGLAAAAAVASPAALLPVVSAPMPAPESLLDDPAPGAASHLDLAAAAAAAAGAAGAAAASTSTATSIATATTTATAAAASITSATSYLKPLPVERSVHSHPPQLSVQPRFTCGEEMLLKFDAKLRVTFLSHTLTDLLGYNEYTAPSAAAGDGAAQLHVFDLLKGVDQRCLLALIHTGSVMTSYKVHFFEGIFVLRHVLGFGLRTRWKVKIHTSKTGRYRFSSAYILTT